MSEFIYQLFGNIGVTFGIQYALLTDFQFEKPYFIPLSIAKIVSTPFRSSDIPEEWFNYLLEQNLIFESTKPELFPAVQTNFLTPAIVSNAVIEIDDNQLDYLIESDVLLELESLGLRAVQFLFRETATKKCAELLKNAVSSSAFFHIEIILRSYSKEILTALLAFSRKEPRVKLIMVYDYSEIDSYDLDLSSFNVVTLKRKFDLKSCGTIAAKLFSFNIDFFGESLTCNTCLNKKLSIDIHGNIKKCLNMSANYFHLNDFKNLKTELESKHFVQLDQINKRNVEVCCDCEFQNACFDCRAFLEKPDNIYSKPLKCGYDPYTGEWSDWRSDPKKQDAIKYYGLEGA